MASSIVWLRIRDTVSAVSAKRWSISLACISLAWIHLIFNRQRRAAEKRIKYGKEASISVHGARTKFSIANESEPGLFKKYSTFESYTTSRASYPRIRTFYKEHYEASKLPGDLPLLVIPPSTTMASFRLTKGIRSSPMAWAAVHRSSRLSSPAWSTLLQYSRSTCPDADYLPSSPARQMLTQLMLSQSLWRRRPSASGTLRASRKLC